MCKNSMKTIKVSEKNWSKLMKWRINLECKNLDEVIERIFKIITKFKLANELYDIKQEKEDEK